MKLKHLTQSLSTAAIGICLLTAAPQTVQAQTSSPAYGVLVSAASWTDVPAYGVCSFHVSGSDNTLTTVKSGDEYGATFGAVYGNNKLLCTKPGYILGGSPIEMAYNIFDGITYGALDSYSADPYITLLASTYDAVTGNTYVLVKDNRNTYSFGTINMANGEISAINNVSAGWHSLASSPQGRLYAISNSGSLLSVNKKTGAVTEIASTGLQSAMATSGEIDPATGRYMFITCNNDKSTLYSIDVNTGNAEKVYDFADCEQILGMHFQHPVPTDVKPSPVRSFSVVFNESSLEGTVKFKAPVTDDNWDMGEGPLTYYVYLDGIEIAKGETTYAGSEINVPVTIPKPGLYEISARTITPGGAASDLTSKELYIGQDTPGNVTDFNATYNGESFTLNWKAPAGQHGGWFDASKVTYTITMQPAGQVIADGITGTTFSYPYAKPQTQEFISFDITPSADGIRFEKTTSNTVAVGDAPEPPYSQTFDNGIPDGYTLIDGNEDGVCFVWEEDGAAKLEIGHIGYEFIDNNDWLVLPPLHLKAGHAYYISFDAYGSYASYTENVALYAATKPTILDFIMGTEVICPTAIHCDKSNPTKLGNYFTPKTDGDYYFGIHGCSTASSIALHIDNIDVSAGMPSTAPGAVTDLTATPGENGAIALTLSYTAPTRNFVGGPLEKLTKVEIYRDDVLAGTQTPEIGARTEWTDPQPTEGDHEYRLVPYNGEDKGDPASVKVHIGIDKPVPTEAIHLAYGRHKSEVVLTWEPVTSDINGTTLTSDMVTYKVLRVHGRDQALIAEGLTECTYTDTFGDSEMEQTAAYYTVVAVTKAGDSAPTNTEFYCLGKDYELPFTESFSDNTLSHEVWVTGNESVNSSWSIKEDPDNYYFTSQDKDNGYLYFITYSGSDKGSFYSGRISLADVPDAELIFYAITPNPYAANRITVRVDPGTGFEDVETFSLQADEGGNMKWKKFKVNLGAFAGQSIRIAFAVETCSTQFVAIDNILVRGLWENDLAVKSFTAPASAKPGIPFDLAATVSNEGSKAQRGYTVTLYCNDKAVETLPGEDLEPEGRTVVNFSHMANSVADKAVYHVTVDLASDNVTANNISDKATVVIKQHNLPSPADLQGTLENGGGSLSWNAPDLESGKADVPVNGGMDDVAPFSIGLPHSELGAEDNIGDWLMVDADGLPTLSDSNISYPNRCKPAAFIAFDNKEIAWEMFEDENGDGMHFLAWAAVGGRNDDWLISPRLNGKAQTVSFYVTSLLDITESYEVLTSDGTRQTSDFTIAGERRYAPTEDWARVDVEVPEGTLYFAIRYVGNDAFGLMLDTFRFVAAGPTADTELTGYNVYRNGSRVNDEPVAATSFIHPEAAEGDSFQVSAVYNGSLESAPSNVVILKESGIGTVLAGDITITIDGRSLIISGAEGESVTVATADGRTIYSTLSADATITLEVPYGVILVRAANRTAKLIVR